MVYVTLLYDNCSMWRLFVTGLQYGHPVVRCTQIGRARLWPGEEERPAFMPASIFSISASFGSMTSKAGPRFLSFGSGGALLLQTPLSS